MADAKETAVVTVRLAGGTGNQLFQIASALSYAIKWKGRFCFTKKCAGWRSAHWESILARAEMYLVDESEISTDLQVWEETMATQHTEPPPLSYPGIKLGTYLQSSKYFTPESAPVIKKLFKMDMPEPLADFEAFLLSNKNRVVVVHARQGDYLQFPDVHCPLRASYYRSALPLMLEHVPDPILLFASDDQKYWEDIRDSLKPFLSHTTIFLPQDYSDVRTFALLQQFKHYIISNSSFIWWCVWLSDHAKHVYAPEQWFGPAGPSAFEDIYEPSWIKVPNS